MKDVDGLSCFRVCYILHAGRRGNDYGRERWKREPADVCALFARIFFARLRRCKANLSDTRTTLANARVRVRVSMRAHVYICVCVCVCVCVKPIGNILFRYSTDRNHLLYPAFSERIIRIFLRVSFFSFPFLSFTFHINFFYLSALFPVHSLPSPSDINIAL